MPTKTNKKEKLGVAPAAAAAAASVAKNTSGTLQAMIGVAVLGIVGVGLYYVTAPIRAANKIAKGAEDLLKDDPKKTQTVIQGRSLSAFSPTFWKEFGKKGIQVMVYTDAWSLKFAKQINAAIGTFTDDEEAIFGVFDHMKTKAHASKVTDFYFREYGKSLYAHLEDNLSTSELAQIVNQMKSRPDYKRA